MRYPIDFQFVSEEESVEGVCLPLNRMEDIARTGKWYSRKIEEEIVIVRGPHNADFECWLMDDEHIDWLGQAAYDTALLSWDTERNDVVVIYGGRVFSRDEWDEMHGVLNEERIRALEEADRNIGPTEPPTPSTPGKRREEKGVG